MRTYANRASTLNSALSMKAALTFCRDMANRSRSLARSRTA